MYADLHSHTNYSDGILTPLELLTKAKAAGIGAISITDHDTVEGVRVALTLADEIGIKVIRGIEISCYENRQNIHILGYNFDIDNPELTVFLKNQKEYRKERAFNILEKLSSLNLPLNFEELLERTGDVPITRPHIAQMMVDKGYVPTLREAFYQYLGEDMPAYVYKSDIPVTAAIEIINKSGGVAVLAHPANWFKPAFLFKLIESGLDGIEVYHPSHNQNLVKHYKSIASQFWLLETGGSDFHGNREYDEMNLGKFGISEKQLETILNHHK
jgi:hypothetical protein